MWQSGVTAGGQVRDTAVGGSDSMHGAAGSCRDTHSAAAIWLSDSRALVQLAVAGSGTHVQLPAMQGRVCCVLNMSGVSGDVHRWMAVVALGFAECMRRLGLFSFHCRFAQPYCLW